MRKTKKDAAVSNQLELITVVNMLAEQKGINKEKLLDVIESALVVAAKEHIKEVTGEDVEVVCDMDRESGIYTVKTKRLVVDEVEDPSTQISLDEVKDLDPALGLGDFYTQSIDTSAFSRIITGVAKSKIQQCLREEEKSALYKEYAEKEHQLIMGTVSRVSGENYNINLGRIEGFLPRTDTVPGEKLNVGDRVRVYVTEVKDNKGPKVKVSRSHPDFVKRLFEREVLEIQDGTVEIKALSREAGSRSKMAVYSVDENVDPVGACVGMNSSRVNAVVDEINGEKIDIVRWDENPAQLIENALSPSKVIGVWADEEEREAIVIVPDYQLSLAIGNKGQNVRLAAKLTSYKIDIHSETEARESGLYEELGVEEGEFVGYYEEYEEEIQDDDAEIVDEDTEIIDEE